MGGRGGQSGIVTVAKRTSGNWDYKGNDQRISQLSNALAGARSVSKINSVARSLRALDKNITEEINRVTSGNEDGSLSALMTQRRKVRQLMLKAKI